MSKDIILYHYEASPYARKIVWYLQLRGIPYKQCLQPMTMPRPDLALLGLHYRRIPVMSIGSDIYCDTRLILSKLEELFPDSPLTSTTSGDQALTHLISSYTTDGGVFVRAAQLLPTSLPIMQDEKFRKDREDYSGRPWSLELIQRAQPEALSEMRLVFDTVETLFSDGREWTLKSTTPTLADLELIFPLLWTSSIPGAFPPEFISSAQYPKVYAWMERFRRLVKSTKNSQAAPVSLPGQDAAQAILSSDACEPEPGVDADPLNLKRGDEVVVGPIDTGTKARDRGVLRSLTRSEIVIAIKGVGGDTFLVHFPRHGFRVALASSTRL